MLTIYIFHSDDSITVRFTGDGEPFNKTLASFQLAIPPQARVFDSRHRHWVIDPARWTTIQDWAQQMASDGARLIVAPAIPNDLILDLHQAYAELHLLPSAPLPLVKGTYRLLATLHHPDIGGAEESMRRLNLAYAQIIEQVFSPSPPAASPEHGERDSTVVH